MTSTTTERRTDLTRAAATMYLTPPTWRPG